MVGMWSGPGAAAALGMLAASLAYAVAAVLVWRRRRAVGARALVLLLLAVVWWTVLYALEIGADSLASATLFGELKYVGIVALAPTWLVFVLQYTGRIERVRRDVLGLLLVQPALVLVLLAVPGTDQLIRYYPAEEAGEAIPLAAAGELFWATSAYAYVLLLGATALFVSTLLRLSARWWRPVTLLVVGVLLPLGVNLAYNLGVEPFAPVDLTPPSFGLMALTLVWGLFRFRLLDLVPVSRHTVVDRMSEGFLVLDPLRRVADVNPAACRMLLTSRADVVGRPVAELLPDLAGTPTDDPVDVVSPLDPAATWSVTVAHVPRRGTDRPGELIVLRDVSERRRAERQLTSLLAERTRTARLLQEALRPATVPHVPGLVLAARYAAAGGGHEVGGDFYDVHPRATGEGWGLVLGDVSGKGAEAAVLATSTRYSARTWGSGDRPPSRVLAAINEVVRGHSEPERFCTALYLAVRVEPDGSMVVRLSLAGHPQPLLRRADGDVQPCGVPGTALGLVREPDLEDVELRLAPGDLLCLYSDGVTEARRGREAYDEQRLAERLGAAHGAAEEVADGLLDDVATFTDTPGRDDVTVLLLGPAPVAQPVPLAEPAARQVGGLARAARPRVHS